jgi:hypothetical protein
VESGCCFKAASELYRFHPIDGRQPLNSAASDGAGVGLVFFELPDFFLGRVRFAQYLVRHARFDNVLYVERLGRLHTVGTRAARRDNAGNGSQ